MWTYFFAAGTVLLIIIVRYLRMRIGKIEKASWNPFDRDRTALLLDDGTEIQLAESNSEYGLQWEVPEGRKPEALILRNITPGLLPFVTLYSLSRGRQQSPRIPFTTECKYREMATIEDMIIRWQEPDDLCEEIQVSACWCLFWPRVTRMVAMYPPQVPPHLRKNEGRTSLQFDSLPGISRTLKIPYSKTNVCAHSS